MKPSLLLAPVVVTGASFWLVACGGGGSDPLVVPPHSFVFDLPAGFPQPRVAASDPMSEEKVALGRFLFYDPRVAFNQGLYEFTFRTTDMGRFRPPSLRNIALTAPYMHDGSIARLREVIVDHYARSGRLIADGPFAGDGSRSPNKDALMIGFSITEREIEELLAFFDSLSDWDFVCDERFADPFGKVPMHERCTSAP